MPFLIAAVVFVGLLCMLDLVLSLGVIKRLREHTELLTSLSGRATIGVGEEIGDFNVVAVDGTPLGRDLLQADTLVGFFSPGCPACKEQLPKFAEFARAMPGGPDRVLAVVTGDPQRTTDMVAALSPVARVVREPAQGGAVSSAFQVAAYPSILRAGPNDDGVPVVTQVRVDLDRRPTTAA
ncbi:hypothetical protein ACWDE9_19885 [Streptomyces olivaceoviridis]